MTLWQPRPLSAARAEKSISTMTCAKFQGSPGDEVKLILTWLDAYYRDEKDPPVIDTELFVANAKKLVNTARPIHDRPDHGDRQVVPEIAFAQRSWSFPSFETRAARSSG